MAEKKLLNEEELEKISGGANLSGDVLCLCPKCSKPLHSGDCETIGSGCDSYLRYTCPHCGHQWEKD